MKKSSLFAAEKSTETIELYNSLTEKGSELFELGGGCLAWQTNDSTKTVLFYDPQRVVAEFFVGGGSTAYSSDSEHVHRMVVDSAFSKVQMKRAHRSPFYSPRYALEWGPTEEVPFPLYMDNMCVVAEIRPDGSIGVGHEGSPVPQLGRTSNIGDIAFVGSTSEPRTDKGLGAFLSDLVPRDKLTELVDRMSLAYALRKEAGPEKPYKALNLFNSNSK